MRRFKHRAERLFHIIVWSTILILGINVLVKGFLILGDNGLGKSTNSIKEKAVSAAVNGMLESGMPILDYVTDKEQFEENGFILNTVLGGFPINRYIAQANDSVHENYIQGKNSLLFSYGNDILFNNEKYIELIMDGIEQAKAAKAREELEPTIHTNTSAQGLLPINIITGDVFLEEEDASAPHDTQAAGTGVGEHFTLEQLLDKNFLYRNFYILDSATTINDKLFDAKKLLGDDMSLKASNDKPQILVYHTHSQEAFADSKQGVDSDTVLGLGDILVKHLEEDYGYNVVHDKNKYDIMGGALDRNLAYNYAGEGIKQILKKYPSIEVVIDIHRDGAAKRVTKVNGENTAQIMLFNGLSRNTIGNIDYLANPNLADNLAFSLQLQLKGREIYPGLMYKNYLHAYRYNMHLRKKSILAEVGTNKNTVEEAKNSMKYLAVILHEVLEGESDKD